MQTVSAAPPPAVTTTSVPVGLAGLTERSLDCSAGSGYLVQLASELDESAFVRRVEEIRAAGTLPADATYLTAQGDCDLFTVRDNLWVLYSGPFTEVEQACPDRLAGPVDGFVKGATQASKGTYVGCVCVTAATALPVLGTGSTGAWVGEMQRALRVELDYDLSDLDTDPALWGVYGGRTQAAVGQVQEAAGLPVTGIVDALTWQAVQFDACQA
ncbi:peptidoglycan-binding protein [Nakamurella flavida]|uniref:Peptidoglycan-binding protein n=1 Tax=Nakamurella flavida TaxID=363630 RepID=A0A938YN91_9ACTN|nr:peptidoglycan-binding domain-containing protein [Nakamurella flavida]MBM9476487.1 peptidoglycan-binding protein [Nakamurella flavida]MDP9779077.1 peptidoglycan hydrolase-like protein with peptidoglycan-binding domain [Nakamurella flavida]